MAQNSGSTLVHYRRADGTVQSVDTGSHAHKTLRKSDDWEKVSRSEAEKYVPRPFNSTAKRKAAQEKAAAEAAEAAEKAKA